VPQVAACFFIGYKTALDSGKTHEAFPGFDEELGARNHAIVACLAAYL
jgi:hypothetical protein